MIRRGHELGHHGYLHERPDFVDEDEEERIMVRGLEVLRVDHRPPSARLPLAGLGAEAEPARRSSRSTAFSTTPA